MKDATQRSVFRWIHIVFAIPILGYIYSPFEKLPDYAGPTSGQFGRGVSRRLGGGRVAHSSRVVA
jgi:hypothetical protein